MSTLDPAVRELLTAMHDALARPDLNPQAPYTAQEAIRCVLRYPTISPPAQMAAWVQDQTVASADANRVRAADRIALHTATRELPS
jgi:hypothetical protein